MLALTEWDFERLTAFVKARFGINLTGKRALIAARLTNELSRRGYTGFREFVDRAVSSPDCEECQWMINRLSTNFSYFFREADYLPRLTGEVIPAFIASGKAYIDFWSAACAGGQEAYSLAMALELLRERRGGDFDYKITGTDINTDVISQARLGEYAHSELERVPREYRKFTRALPDGGFRVCEALRDKIAWGYFNLMEAGRTLGEYDVILCRNALIYFTPATRREIVCGLHGSLRPGGYLYTGATEPIDLERKLFKYIAPATYKKES